MRSMAIMSHGWTSSGMFSRPQWARNVSSDFVVEIARPHVVADLHAVVARGLRAARLAAGRIDVLQRHLRQGLEALRRVLHELQRAVVHALAPRQRALDRIRVAEHHRRRADDLDVDAVAVHVLEPRGRVPQRRLDRTERLVALHDLAGAVGVLRQPRRVDRVERRGFLPRDRREEVGVHVDGDRLAHAHATLAFACHAAWSRPGCTVPHLAQVRSASDDS